MTDLDVTRDWKTLLAMLPADYEALAHEHKQLETQWPTAKIHGADDLLRLIFVHAGADLPLRQTVATVAAAGGPSISPNVLHKKMRKAGSYLGALVARMTDWKREAEPECWAGYEMLAVDAPHDLALLKVEAQAPAWLPPGNPDELVQTMPLWVVMRMTSG